MITIVCWKWKPEKGGRHEEKRLLFSAEHVNRLRASIERNTTVKHRFVCVTDNAKGLHSSVEPINIDRHFGDFKDWGGCYRRLKAFDYITGLSLFGPRFISFDLDVVVTGNLDPILSFTEDFRIWFDKHRRKTPYCGSLWGMKAGARQKVWDSFNGKPNRSVELMRRLEFVGTDQAHISACLIPASEKTWGVEDGVYNFNTRIRKHVWQIIKNNKGDMIEKRTDGSLPLGTTLVFFNGKYDPSQPVLQNIYPWIKEHWNA
jgi:hypothetical protein